MNSRRLHYLRALDVDVWQRRDLAANREQARVDANRESGIGNRESQGRANYEPQVAKIPAASGTLNPTVETSSSTPASRFPIPDSRQPEADSAVASMDWDALVNSVRSCTKCALHATRTQAVFGVGNRKATWMVIGEAPGADEDKQGEPFVGRAGQLLNSMLRAMGLAREEVFIANILKSRPPGNRDPRPEEVRACIPYLFRQIELVNPTLLLCVGRIAAQTLLETDTPIGKLRGRLHRVGPGRPMVVTYHPAYLLRSPGEKRKAWADLVLAMQTYQRLAQEAGRPS
jgi:DNA polymerase